MSASVEQFGRALVAAKLFTADQVKELWNGLPNVARPTSGDQWSSTLIEQGKLTPYQAAEVLAGHTQSLVLGDYVILEKIGQGGMGQVFKARHKRLKRQVAIKLLPPEAVKDQAAIKRFEREVEAVGRLSHPHIVQAFDAGAHAGQHYLVMELIDGSDLASLVKRHGPLPVVHAVSCVIQAALGLEHAHAQGLVHRDIKPSNLLIDHEGTVKVLDLGLARFDDVLGEREDGLTGTGNIMGTVDFMSPEQAYDTKRVDGRADIYSLGCTLYYLLTGLKPYDGDTVMQKLLAHREARIPSIQSTRPEVPAEVDTVYQRMVEKSPDERYQTMGEVLRALEACLPSAREALSETMQFSQGSSSLSSSLKSYLQGLSAVATAPPVTGVARDDTQGIQAPHARTASHAVQTGQLKRRERCQTTTKPKQKVKLAIAGSVILLLAAGGILASRFKSDKTPVVAKEEEHPVVDVTPGSDQPSAKQSSIDLMPFVPVTQATSTPWRRVDGAIEMPPTEPGIANYRAINYSFPAYFELRSVVERLSGDDSIIFFVTSNKLHIQIRFDNRGGGKHFAMITGGSDVLKSKVVGEALKIGEKHTISIRIDPAGLMVKIDDQEILRREGALESLSVQEARMPFVVRAYSPFRIHSLELIPLSPLPVAPVNLLKLCKPQSDAGGSWDFSQGDLVLIRTDKGSSSTLQLDYDAPQEYDLNAVVERLQGQGGLVLGLVAGASRFQIRLDYGGNRSHSLGYVDGTPDKIKNTQYQIHIATGATQSICVRVRRTGISIELEGQELLKYEGTLDRLTRPEFEDRWPKFYLRGYDNYRVSKLELTMVDSAVPERLPISPK